MRKKCIRKFKFPQEIWDALERKAQETGSYVRTGPLAGTIQVGEFFRRIADGEIAVRELGPHMAHIKRIDEALAKQEQAKTYEQLTLEAA